MPTEDRRPVPETIEKRSAQGRVYLGSGALVVAVLVGAYVVAGMPGLHTQVAKAPVTIPTASGPTQD
jgi:hypothetical protein